VGVATQDPILRKRFKGLPEHVINYFLFVAEDMREIMASMGFRSVDEMVGRADMLDMKLAIDHWKARGVDLTNLLHHPPAAPNIAIRHVEKQRHPIDDVL